MLRKIFVFVIISSCSMFISTPLSGHWFLDVFYDDEDNTIRWVPAGVTLGIFTAGGLAIWGANKAVRKGFEVTVSGLYSHPQETIITLGAIPSLMYLGDRYLKYRRFSSFIRDCSQTYEKRKTGIGDTLHYSREGEISLTSDEAYFCRLAQKGYTAAWINNHPGVWSKPSLPKPGDEGDLISATQLQMQHNQAIGFRDSMVYREIPTVMTLAFLSTFYLSKRCGQK